MEELHCQPFLSCLILIGELRCAKRASRAPWIRFLGKAIHVRNLGYDVTYVRLPSACTDCWGGGGEAGEPLGTGVFGNFPWQCVEISLD